MSRSYAAQETDEADARLKASFLEEAKPFLDKNCLACHNEDNPTSGVNVSVLDGSLEERRLRTWGAIKRNLVNQTMPPEGLPQPPDDEREAMIAWIDEAVNVARARPTPKNGIVRRLTVAQYRNTLRDLLNLEDDLTAILPPDAVSEHGFINSAETLELSPLLMESYFEIADEALDRAIVNPDEKPTIQSFKVEMGEGINPTPLEEELILGANSMLLDDADYTIEQLQPEKDFAYEPFRMRTKFRYIEGYEGNGTVRGWRDFDSIYHAVFADMRGSRGYPKGEPYSVLPEGLLLRPAIPTDEIFTGDGTYGHMANFKLSLRELPTHGRFRVTVKAARYDDGLLLDEGAEARSGGVAVKLDPALEEQTHTVTVPKAGVYQVDVYEVERAEPPAPDDSRLTEGLGGAWSLDGAGGQLEGDAAWTDSPFGQGLSLDGDGDALLIPHDDGMDVGVGDFTVAAWIRPEELRNAGVAVHGTYDQKPGWRLSTGGNGSLQLRTVGPKDPTDGPGNGGVSSKGGVIVAEEWHHVAAVVRRDADTRLYVNGYLVAKGEVGPANLDNTDVAMHVGRLSYTNHFKGGIDEVRVYQRALEAAELQALIEPGREMATPPAESTSDVTLSLNGRRFEGRLEQPAFLAVRLDKGPLKLGAGYGGLRGLERVELTPLAEDDAVAKSFRTFESRVPRLGVHMGFRRDCGSTFAPVSEPQLVEDTDLREYVFEGAIANYPNPDVEENNVNYLAGIREIGVRSEHTDGRDMPRLLIRSVEFEGPYYETWPPKSHQTVFVETDDKTDARAYARKILRNFASRAYRRDATTGEEAALMGVFDDSMASGAGFRQSVKDALSVALTSPQFLFLIESSTTPEPEPIGEHELASKLSYFLWNEPPDARLLELARRGALRASLDEEVRRMVADERFAHFASQFTSQWLSLDKFDVLEPDRERYPKLTREARAALRQEPVELVKYLFEQNLPASNLIESDFVMANEIVADYYGLAAKTESGFRFQPIRHEREELGGLLTQAAILAGLSDGRESNPVKRGAWLARKIVAEPPDPPPPNVPDLAAETEHLTLRERLEQHRNQPGCFQCHTKIDPWGVALEELDAGGRMKEDEVDARSTLPDGTEVAGVLDLKKYLAGDRMDQVAFSVLKHLFIYANGRDLTYNERNHLQQDALTLRDKDYRMQELLLYVVNSELFLEK